MKNEVLLPITNHAPPLIIIKKIQPKNSMDNNNNNNNINNNSNEWSDHQQERFDTGVSEIFNRWTLIKIVVDNQFAGNATNEIVDQIQNDVLDMFWEGGSDIHPDEIEDYFLDMFSSKLFTDVQDGSCNEVC